jgi:hypothetical protein
MRDDEFDGTWEEMDGEEFLRRHSSGPKVNDLPPLTIKEWRERKLPPLDLLLGHWMSTSVRVLLAADTGLGKTNFCMALAAHAAAGKDFLHWRAHRPARVLYIDGEMSRRLYGHRIDDAERRLGCDPGDNLMCMSSEDIENFPPLNTPEGLAFLEEYIERVEERIGARLDFIFFDNVMALIQGDQKDEVGWTAVLPLINRLTKRRIGQLWVNHTGHNATRGYGSKTKEWRMDTVIHLTAAERADADICFQMEFRKARERTPASRADFEDVTIALVDDKWIGTIDEVNRGKPSDKEASTLEAFDDLVKDHKTVQRPDGQWAIKRDDWERECVRRGIVDRANQFRNLKSRLVHKKIIQCDGEWSWRT